MHTTSLLQPFNALLDVADALPGTVRVLPVRRVTRVSLPSDLLKVPDMMLLGPPLLVAGATYTEMIPEDNTDQL